MPSSDPDISRPRLVRDGSFLEADWSEIAQRRGAHNRLGFAYQIAFVRILGRFPRQVPLEIDGEILRFTALQLKRSTPTPSGARPFPNISNTFVTTWACAPSIPRPDTALNNSSRVRR